MPYRPNSIHRSLLVASLASIALVGCDDGNTPASKSKSAPVYAIASLTFGDQGSTTYLALLDGFTARERVTLDSAQEFAGYAPANAIGDSVYVGSGEGPSLQRFSVFDDFHFEEGETLSFGAYASMPLQASIFVDEDTAYTPVDGTSHVVWDPTAMSIVGQIAGPAEIPLERDGLRVWAGYAHEIRDSLVFQPYYFASEDYQRYTSLSQVKVIDSETNTVAAVVDIDCPHLHITTQDEDGNVYLSNGQGSIAAAVLDDEHPRNCFAKIGADGTAVNAGFPIDFRDLTDGREGSNFFYIGDGIGFFNVFHAERQTIDEDTTFAEVDYSSNYHIWTLDLATMEAQMMPGVDYAGGQYVAFRIDGRTILTIPAPDYSSTAVYEVTPHGGATKLFDVDGWAFKLFRVR